jgi:drug/metabolite transporter (DMT)-like permease
MLMGDLFALGSALANSFAVIFMRVAGYQIPPLSLNFFRVCVGVVLTVLTLVVLGEPLLVALPAVDYWRLIISAVLGIAVADTMIAASINRLGASLQALANCAYTPAITLVGFVMYGEMLNSWEIIGGLLVVSGVFVGAVMKPETTSVKNLWMGIALAAGAHITMGVAILMVRDIYREVSLIWVSGFRLSIAALAIWVFAQIRYPRQLRSELLLGFVRPDMWRSLIPMAVLGPYVAMLCWIAGFKYLEAGRAAIYNQMATVFIILLAYFLLGEKITARKMLGVVLALIGAMVVALQ